MVIIVKGFLEIGKPILRYQNCEIMASLIFLKPPFNFFDTKLVGDYLNN